MKDHSHQNHPAIQNAHASTAAAAAVQTATPLDMYGWEHSKALGRRSFGGFRPVTAENWFHQQQEQQLTAASSGRQQPQPTDEELLQRRRHSNNSNNSSGSNRNRKRKQAKSGNQQGLSSSSNNRNLQGDRREKLLDSLMLE